MSEILHRKCYAAECGYIGKAEDFESEGGRECPRCGSQDNFPYRRYRCLRCGTLGDQHYWFPELELDLDPFKQKSAAIPCKECYDSAYATYMRTRTKLAKDERELKLLKTRPASLEEIRAIIKPPTRAVAKPLKPGRFLHF